MFFTGNPLSFPAFKKPENLFSSTMGFPTRLWLTKAVYLEGKKEVRIEFSRLNLRRMSRFAFFPSFFLSKKQLGVKALKEILSSSGKRFKILEEEKTYRVSASTFSGLEAIADLLFQEIGFRPLVLNPERQFLLERKWSYFDCFAFLSENQFSKLKEPIFPETILPFFSEPLRETISLLAEESSELGQKLSDSIALSKILALPLTSLPQTAFQKTEALLSGLFWKTGINAKPPYCAGKALEKSRPLVPSPKGLAEVDFGMLWPTLLTKPIYNLGPDSIDCNCCKPKDSNAKNILPSSIVLAKVLQDGFFFESGLPSFSEKFHKTRQGKESRLRRKKEFCLNSFPIGPLFRNQKISLPLSDALALKSNSKAFLFGFEEMHWFCKKKESLVSRLVFDLSKTISEEEKKQDKMRALQTKKHGVLGTALLSKNPDFILSQSLSKTSFGFLHQIPKHLCSEKSAFSSGTLRSAIEAVEDLLLRNFESFAVERESRVVSVAKEKAFVKTERPYSLIKKFSEKQKIPLLLRAKTTG